MIQSWFETTFFSMPKSSPFKASALHRRELQNEKANKQFFFKETVTFGMLTKIL
jgi:hypothetical protein